MKAMLYADWMNLRQMCIRDSQYAAQMIYNAISK